jgi:pyruvate-formate lyase
VRERIRRTREILVSTPDTVCLERARLATEGYQRWADEPTPIKRAKTFAHILHNMTLDLDTNPIFAGNTSSRPRAWMLLPEYGFNVPNQAIVENPSFEGFLDTIPDELRAFWQGKSVGGGAGIGHLAVNLQRVVSEGLESIIAEAESYPSTEYRQATIIALRAVIDWAQRYGTEACRQVPAKPARNLFEALQAIALVHLAIAIEGHGYSVSLAHLDRILLPYYDGAPETTELLAAFMLKITSNSIWGSHSKTQAITLGGLDSNGNDMCNPLTLHFLDACDMVRMPDPHVFLRWHEKIDRRVKERAIELLGSGLSMPMLVGDEQTAQGFINAGIPKEDAWNYCVIGCNELGIPGKLWDSATGPFISDPAILREAVTGLSDVSDLSDLSDSVRAVMKQHLTLGLRNTLNGWDRAAKNVPTPFTSALMDGCVERGSDLHNGMQYSLPVVMERGFTNAVNGLAAIACGTVSIEELKQALQTDFADESIRQRLLNAPKWGNDDDRADKWAQVWMDMREEVLREVEADLHSKRHIVQHVIRSLHHIDGLKLGATPDGRRAGMPVADSIGAVAGTALEGPTALLNSVLKLRPAKYWQGGYNLNLTLSPNAVSDKNLLALVDAFFADGGQELQIGCLDADTLRDAKAHPEKYPDLLVRIAGFNALFAKLSPAEQDELIARAELSEL